MKDFYKKGALQKSCSTRCRAESASKIFEKYLWRSSIWLKPTACNFTKKELFHRYFAISFSEIEEHLFFRKTAVSVVPSEEITMLGALSQGENEEKPFASH